MLASSIGVATSIILGFVNAMQIKYAKLSCNWHVLTLLQNRPLFLAICPGSLWARDNRWLLSRVQRLAGPAGGRGLFVPV